VRDYDLNKDLLGKISFAQMLYLMLEGQLPSAEQARMIDAMLIVLVDHGMTTGAAAARMTFHSAPEAIQGAVAAAILGAGISVVVFPEGTRSADGNLLPFKKGGFLLAVKTRTPVVAITINGSHKLLPRGRLRVRPGTVEVSISAPITTTNHRPGSVRAISRQVEQIIADKLRPAGQALEVARETAVGLSA